MISYFSIVIPTYNRASRIVQAIQSILTQSFQDFEIIVIDDASTDNTFQIVSEIKDDRIKYYRNETNQERCLSRNKGIELAQGTYICFLDSDDYHLPNHLETLYLAIQEKKEPVAFFFTNAWDETEDGLRSERNCPLVSRASTRNNTLTSRASVNEKNVLKRHSLNENSELEDSKELKDNLVLAEALEAYTYFLRYTVNPQRWCVHREIFEKVKFDPEVIICEDMDTSLRIVSKNYPIFQIKERTTVYVAAKDSFTHGDSEKWEKEVFYLKRIFVKKELKGKLLGKEKKRLLSMCYFHLSRKSFDKKQRLKTIIYSLKSFFLCFKGYNGKTNRILIYQLYRSIFSFKNRCKEKLDFKLPLNLKDDELSLIKKHQLTEVEPSNVLVLNNAFVSHEGLVLKNGFLIKRCAFNLKGKLDNTFGKIFQRLTLEQFLVAKFGKSLKGHKVEEPLYVIHTKWFNYSFWITDSLVRLILLEEKGILSKAKLIYPVEWTEINFVTDALQAFNVKTFKLPKGEHVFSKKLYFPETREWTSSFSPSQIQKVRKRLVSYVNDNNIKSHFSDRIYLTRQGRGIRTIENEQEVIELLKGYNFSIVNFEELSFWEQVATMHNATAFISIHGAGFANILFMNEGSFVLELINKAYAEKEYKFPFYHLASSLNLKYQAQFGVVSNNNTQELFDYSNDYKANESNFLVNQNIAIDIELLKIKLADLGS